MKYATKEEQARFENIATDVAKKYGFTTVAVEIIDFDNFKVQWTRTHHDIKFKMSDYLCGAPDEVVADIFDVVCKKFTGEDNAQYSKATSKYLTTKIAGKYRRTYCARNDIEPHKFTEFNGIPVHYAKKPLPVGKKGGASVLMKVIAVNPIFKGADEGIISEIIKDQYDAIQVGLKAFGVKKL